jgi:putative aminopeptidase FrvX
VILRCLIAFGLLLATVQFRPGAAQAPPPSQDRRGLEEAREVLRQLVEAYGVSGSEGAVRETVTRLLPEWAEPNTDATGNLHVRAGAGPPLVVFIAHLDEVGFAVTAIRDDGLLELERRGGFYPSLFEGEPALVHTVGGIVHAVFSAREPAEPSPRRDPGPLRADPGTASRAATEALGIRVGDTVTMPKELVPLAGTRATARSLDDRVGCAAQVLALRRLDPRRLRHAVEFIWSVREEVGLEGAEFAAVRLAPERPVRVHALDTFVSSDAPLEVKTFAHAPLGRGAVVRAVDNSAVAPPALVDSLVALARERRIPLQVGTTGGGNDGSAFTRHGVAGVAIGWPLRYSHSPAEVMDLVDLLALADIARAIAERW